MDINVGDYDSRTPLHLSVSAGHIDVVKHLIESGANINCRDRWGATPLNDADDPAIVTYLKQHGAEKGVEDMPSHLELP